MYVHSLYEAAAATGTTQRVQYRLHCTTSSLFYATLCVLMRSNVWYTAKKKKKKKKFAHRRANTR